MHHIMSHHENTKQKEYRGKLDPSHLGFQSGLIQNWQRGFGVKSSDIWCRFRIVAVGLLTLAAGATSLWLGVGGTLAAGTMAWDSLHELANFCRSLWR